MNIKREEAREYINKQVNSNFRYIEIQIDKIRRRINKLQKEIDIIKLK